MLRSGPMPSVILALMLTAGAGLPGFNASGPAQNPVQLMAVTELKAGAMGHYLVRAQINHSDIDVMVDTGASVVAMKMRKRLGCTLVLSITMYLLLLPMAWSMLLASNLTGLKLIRCGLKMLMRCFCHMVH
jgi:hypothetical protein